MIPSERCMLTWINLHEALNSHVQLDPLQLEQRFTIRHLSEIKPYTERHLKAYLSQIFRSILV